jgi:hypothetical protein
MYLIQILLPLTDNAGKPLASNIFTDIKVELTGRFKGLTVYSRAPAEGLWKPRAGTRRDEIVVYEVMVDQLDRAWWQDYRAHLEQLCDQESIVIRAEQIEVL